MNNEAESSGAGPSHVDTPSDDEDELDYDDVEEEARMQAQRMKERRLDAKRKRVLFLDKLLRELDSLMFVELVALYHLDCSFFWFLLRAMIHISVLTPIPDMQLARQQDEHKAFLPLILVTFAVNSVFHLVYKAPSAGEETRGYLHGGLLIDFIGQQGPTSKWKLIGLDMAILLLQLVMVSVYVKKRDLKQKLAKMTGVTISTETTEGESANTAGGHTAEPTTTDREQDADAEERGLLRRTDTMSDAGQAEDEEDALLATSSETGPVDSLDTLTSGQAVIGDFTIIDTLLQEHADYNVYRRTRTETGAGSGLSPDAMRQLHSIRMRFGVGGG